MRFPSYISKDLQERLAKRVNRLHLKLRLGIEEEGEQPVFGQGRNLFHIENWLSLHAILKTALRLSGLNKRGQKNCHNLRVTHNDVHSAHLPKAFDGYRILHLSDLHIDLDSDFASTLSETVENLEYDLCVLTGDYRFLTSGSTDASMAGMAQLRQSLRGDAYAVLGNHDSICTVAELEDAGYHLLLNESVQLQRGAESIALIGVDDPHFFRADNLEKACEGVANDEYSILLVHSPELYKQAAYADLDLLLCGHTHGGQFCLPGGFPLMVNAECPRALCRGSWIYDKLQGYTSVSCGASIVPARFNCSPEVTIHTLYSSAP